MEPLIINHDTLDAAIKGNDMLVVDMWASWCGPCRRFLPIFDQAAATSTDVVFARLQVDASDENQATFEGLGYTTVPTLMAFKGGTLVTDTSGALGKSDLTTVLDTLQAA
ncbi:MAG: thioredoxin family protein [Propionibacteriaceae bacterium]|nr:thioredoxin family protein [Propionibacteriaceae bacterium]MCL2482076.1 thioredoxin family protein [Propionibacteriaceae bacterium]